MTNKQLWDYYQTSKKDTFCNFLNKSKIREFYREYGIRIETLAKKMIAIQEKYYESKGFKPNGQLDVVLEEVEIDGKKQIRPKLREGMTDADFKKEHNELMSQDIVGSGLKIIQPNGH